MPILKFNWEKGLERKYTAYTRYIFFELIDCSTRLSTKFYEQYTHFYTEKRGTVLFPLPPEAIMSKPTGSIADQMHDQITFTAKDRA